MLRYSTGFRMRGRNGLARTDWTRLDCSRVYYTPSLALRIFPTLLTILNRVFLNCSSPTPRKIFSHGIAGRKIFFLSADQLGYFLRVLAVWKELNVLSERRAVAILQDVYFSLWDTQLGLSPQRVTRSNAISVNFDEWEKMRPKQVPCFYLFPILYKLEHLLYIHLTHPYLWMSRAGVWAQERPVRVCRITLIKWNEM